MPATLIHPVDRWTAIEALSTSARIGFLTPAAVPWANADAFSILALMSLSGTSAGIIASKRRTSAPNAGWNLVNNGTTGNMQFTRQANTVSLSYITNNTPLAAALSRRGVWWWLLCEYDEAYAAGERVKMSVRRYDGGRWLDATFGTATDGTGGYVDDSAQGIRIWNHQAGNAGNSGRQLAMVAVLNPMPIGQMKRAIDTGKLLDLRKRAYVFLRPGNRVRRVFNEGRILSAPNAAETWEIDITYGTDFKIVAGPPVDANLREVDWLDEDEEIGSSGVTGTAAITLGAATLVAAGTVAVDGDLALTLGGVGLTAAGTVPVDGDVVVTLDGVGLAAAGTVALVGAAGVTLEALTLTAAGVVGGPVTGTLTATLDGIGLAAAGTVAVDGDLAVTLGALTLSATGGAPGADGSALITLAGVGLTAVGVVVVGGAQATTLGAATLTAAGAVAITGSVAITLGTLTLTALDDGGTIRAGRKTVVTVGDTRTRATVGDTRTRAAVGETRTRATVTL